jgi:hypothetical protein
MKGRQTKGALKFGTKTTHDGQYYEINSTKYFNPKNSGGGKLNEWEDLVLPPFQIISHFNFL